MRYWGAGLSRLQRENGIVWATLTLEDRQAAGYPGRDDADLINLLSAINDALISIIFVEQTKGSVKVSWRSQPGVDISSVALKLGGGGHPSASGAEVKGSLDEVREQVLTETRRLIREEIIV
jgi:phosphoesterase RecJ-like protein